MRRLPIYLLVDVSGSMSGDPINQVNTGLQIMQDALQSDPMALETVYVSVIKFDSTVRTEVPLTAVPDLSMPTLKAGGCTSLGEALAEVTRRAEQEVVKTTENKKGDWRPQVYLFTDGIPTDDVRNGLATFKKYHWGMVVACGTDDADFGLLHQITENVIRLDTADKDQIKKFFQWVSASVSVSSQRVDVNGQTSIGMLPPPPGKIDLEKH